MAVCSLQREGECLIDRMGNFTGMRWIAVLLLILVGVPGFGQVSREELRNRSVAAIRVGRYDEAVHMLESAMPLIRTDTNGLFDALINLYVFRKDWPGILRAYEGYPFRPGADSTVLTIARFHTAFPAEELIFTGSVPIPFRTQQSATPVIPVIVNGREYRFWFDTGAGMTVVSSRVAAACGIKTSSPGSAVAIAATGKAVGLAPGQIDSLALPGLTVRHHGCIILDAEDLTFRKLGIPLLRIDGIIGWNLLQELDVTIDGRQNRIVLAPKTTGARAPEPNFFWYSEPQVTARDTAGNDLSFFLDTGAGTSGLFSGYRQKGDTSRATRKQVTFGSAGGTRRLTTLVFPQVRLLVDGRWLALHKVALMPHHSNSLIDPDGVLGMDALKGLRLHFNVHQGFFRISD